MKYITLDITYRPRQTPEQTAAGRPNLEKRKATVSFEIDIEAIHEQLGHRAIHNSSGKAIAYGGLLKAKVVKR